MLMPIVSGSHVYLYYFRSLTQEYLLTKRS